MFPRLSQTSALINSPLSLSAPVKPLQIKIIADSKRLEASQEVTFQCIVYGARPQPTIGWSLVDDASSDLNGLNNVDNFIENELSGSSSYFDSNWYRPDVSAVNKNQQPLKDGAHSRNNSRTLERFRPNSNRTSSNGKASGNSDVSLAGLSFQTARKTAITQVLSESENIHSSQIRIRLNEK